MTTEDFYKIQMSHDRRAITVYCRLCAYEIYCIDIIIRQSTERQMFEHQMLMHSISEREFFLKNPSLVFDDHTYVPLRRKG